MTQKNKAPQSQPEAIIASVQDMPSETAEKVVSLADTNKRNRLNALATVAARETEAVRNKVELLHQAESAIEDTVKLAGDAVSDAELETKVAEAAGKVADILFRGRVQGVLAPDEATNLLGTGFGWKVKKNGEQSKTPHGQGEAIRKRVVRAVDAYSFITGGEAKAFFEPLEAAAVKPLVASVLKGEASVYRLYDKLGEMKQEASADRLPTAFNPKAILKLAANLTENVDASVQNWHDIPGLFEAFVGLYRAVSLISEEYGEKYTDEISEAA